MFDRLTVKIWTCLFIQMLELVVKNGSEEDQILDFVGKFIHHNLTNLIEIIWKIKFKSFPKFEYSNEVI